MMQNNIDYFKGITNKYYELKDLFSIVVERQSEDRYNSAILDSLIGELEAVDINDVNAFFLQNKFVTELIKLKYDLNYIYRQPLILLLYYMADKMPNKLKILWPYTPEEIGPVFVDLSLK
ncbi:MAG: hypothetical protein ABFD50_20325 [Smithella sp.]